MTNSKKLIALKPGRRSVPMLNVVEDEGEGHENNDDPAKKVGPISISFWFSVSILFIGKHFEKTPATAVLLVLTTSMLISP